jgi:hypothetical protein
MPSVETKVAFKATTTGNGFWTRQKKSVEIYALEMRYFVDKKTKEKIGDLRAYFNTSDWDVDKHDLIYTDEGWLKDLHAELKKMGFADALVKSVGYSEAGMQGDDFVSLDCSSEFVEEFLKKFGSALKR